MDVTKIQGQFKFSKYISQILLVHTEWHCLPTFFLSFSQIWLEHIRTWNISRMHHKLYLANFLALVGEEKGMERAEKSCAIRQDSQSAWSICIFQLEMNKTGPFLYYILTCGHGIDTVFMFPIPTINQVLHLPLCTDLITSNFEGRSNSWSCLACLECYLPR